MIVDKMNQYQKNQLITIRDEYMKLLEKRGENKFLRDRINAINIELIEVTNTIKRNTDDFGLE